MQLDKIKSEAASISDCLVVVMVVIRSVHQSVRFRLVKKFRTEPNQLIITEPKSSVQVRFWRPILRREKKEQRLMDVDKKKIQNKGLESIKINPMRYDLTATTNFRAMIDFTLIERIN